MFLDTNDVNTNVCTAHEELMHLSRLIEGTRIVGRNDKRIESRQAARIRNKSP